MKHLFYIAALLVATFAPHAQAQTFQTGLADLEIKGTENHHKLGGFIWYPTDQTTGLADHHGNPVWIGIDAIKDAQPASEKFPLVLLSHGMYGNAMNQSWLAAELAGQGFVVAAINHPGTSTWLRDPDDARQLWQRPKDISRLIDHFINTPELNALIDADRIFMAGHSLGGFTAIALAGGRYDAAKIDLFCADMPGELVCGIFDQWNVAKTPEDRAKMQADLSDPRIRGFGVFDLGGTQSFSTASLGAITSPMLVFGAPRDISGLDLDIESRALVAALPASNVQYLEPDSLSHFDFLGECRPGAAKILASEEPGDEIICVQGGAERRDEHRMISQTVATFFNAI